MAKYTGKLTKTAVDGWEYHANDPILWDGKLTGFGVKANKCGSKTYLADYRNKYNVKRRYTIGKHGGELTTDQARNEAKELLAKIRLGFDPLADKQTTRQAISVNQLIDNYLASAKFAEKTPMTRYNDTGRIKRHLRPTLGKLKVEQVTADRVRRAFADIRDGKTAVVEKTKKARGKAVVRGGAGAARMAIRNLRAIYTWAIAEGLATSNPAAGIEIGSDGRRESILETAESYAALFAALDKLETQRRITDAVADCIRVLAFTGARRNEIAAMRWAYVNLDRGIITLPPKAHKTGHRSGKPKEIALSAEARSIIDNRPRGGPEDYVFPPSKGDSPLTLSSKMWGLISKEAGLPAGITNHSLRHSLGTLMAVQGAEAAQIMAALGHSTLSTAARYIHIAKDARVQMAEKYTAGIAAVFNGAPKAVVVKLKSKKRGAK